MLKKHPKPIDFPGRNCILKSISDMDGELPVYVEAPYVLSCWKIPFLNRIKILFTGKIWLCIKSGSSHPPTYLTTVIKYEKRNSFMVRFFKRKSENSA